jgi:hypothetical protein
MSESFTDIGQVCEFLNGCRKRIHPDGKVSFEIISQGQNRESE